MGCLFSSEEERGNKQPLLPDPHHPQPNKQLSFKNPKASAASSSAGSGREEEAPAAAAAAARKMPTFKKPVVVSAGVKAVEGVGIFCSCGGPGSLVELLPCKHHALCLSCAQSRETCPVCSDKFTDSKPSFRLRKE